MEVNSKSELKILHIFDWQTYSVLHEKKEKETKCFDEKFLRHVY